MKLRRIFAEMLGHISRTAVVAGALVSHNPSILEAQEFPQEPEPFAVETVDAGTIDTSSPAFVQVTGEAAPLKGLVDACKRGDIECPETTATAKAVVFDDKFLEAINASNAMVNEIRGMDTDLEVHGKEEVWTTGYESQDCEDDKMEKRDYLNSRYQIPYEAMSFVHVDTNVIEETGKRESHLLLMVRSTKGDYFLDNLTDKVYRTDERFPMDGSGYVLHSMSSFENILKWKELEDTRHNMPAAAYDDINDVIKKGEEFSTKATFPHKPAGFKP